MAGNPSRRGSVRIIGGQWRGRRLQVPDVPGLRPSGDRGRETLFNWLQPWLVGADCVDLFAGSGALGLEAASRGAQSVTLVEYHGGAAALLDDTIRRLGAAQVHVVQGDALRWLGEAGPQQADIVFVDPPFDTDLLARTLSRLVEYDTLRPGGWVYAESAAQQAAPAMPAPFKAARDKQLGDVRMQLFRRD